MSLTVTAATSPLNCIWIAPGSRLTKSRGVVLAGALLVAALTPVSDHGWQANPDHATHQSTPASESKKMAGMKAMDMKASNAKLDELVAKMNAAQGQTKVTRSPSC